MSNRHASNGDMNDSKRTKVKEGSVSRQAPGEEIIGCRTYMAVLLERGGCSPAVCLLHTPI